MLEKLRMLSVFAVILAGAGSLTACNTVSGVGEDVEAVGDTLSDSAEENKNY